MNWKSGGVCLRRNRFFASYGTRFIEFKVDIYFFSEWIA